tara:strand:+ start:273 stop:467 length:195 start_codon:yes stop_codon:yes gene_type:complete
MLLEALTKKLEGDIAVARANVGVYLKQSVGIGEHPDIIGAIEGEIEKIASADEKIKTIENFWLT